MAYTLQVKTTFSHPYLVLCNAMNRIIINVLPSWKHIKIIDRPTFFIPMYPFRQEARVKVRTG